MKFYYFFGPVMYFGLFLDPILLSLFLEGIPDIPQGRHQRATLLYEFISLE